MNIKFGFCLPIFAMPGSRFFRTPSSPSLQPSLTFSSGLLAEELGFDSLWIADHLMLGQDDAILEGWTTLCTLAGATESVQLGLIHQANLFRNPALAAKMMATLDQLSNGRFIFFADPGSAAAEHQAYGLPWIENQSERIKRFEESLSIILHLWQNDKPYSTSGTYYTVHEANCNPKPLQSPHPPIWIGSASEEMHHLCAKYAQGWNTTPISLKDLIKRQSELKIICEKQDRNVTDLERSLEIQILIGRDLDDLRKKILHIISLDSKLIPIDEFLQAFLSSQTDEIPPEMKNTWLVGTPKMIGDQIIAYSEAGISHFMLWFVDWPNEEGLRLFSEKVVSKFK